MFNLDAAPKTQNIGNLHYVINTDILILEY